MNVGRAPPTTGHHRRTFCFGMPEHQAKFKAWPERYL
jgi:hypothetical protein